MLPPPPPPPRRRWRWRWTREPLNSCSACVWRMLCSRRHSLWILLILLLVCVAIQTFVARHARNDKLTEVPQLRFTVSRESVFPPLQSEWGGVHSDLTLAAKPPVVSPHTDRTAQKAEYGAPSHHIPSTDVDTTARSPAASPTQAGRLSPGERRFPGDEESPPPADTCQPKSRIVFLKTHKTASSTILNILYRYGESRNLTFALPLNKHSQLFYPFFFAAHFVEGVGSRAVREFHIMCNHMRFRKSEVAKVMPADTFYFSILRHPVAMMESIFIYYKSIPAFHKTPTLDNFLDNSRKYNSSLSNNHYAHNILAFDFGFDNNVANEDLEDRASKAIAAMERDFHLILISEYFDESMILLKHALCWSMEDVVSFKLNSRSERTRRPLTPETAEKIKSWNALDWRIYLHFNATFWHKVESLVGRERMRTEVAGLRELQAKLAKTCLLDGGAVDPSQIKDTGLKPFQYGAAIIQGYNLNPNVDTHTKTKCQRLITPELQYTDHLYTQQFPQQAARLRRAPRVAASPQRQSADRTGMLGKHWARDSHHRLVRRRIPHLKNQEASRAAAPAHAMP